MDFLKNIYDYITGLFGGKKEEISPEAELAKLLPIEAYIKDRLEKLTKEINANAKTKQLDTLEDIHNFAYDTCMEMIVQDYISIDIRSMELFTTLKLSKCKLGIGDDVLLEKFKRELKFIILAYAFLKLGGEFAESQNTPYEFRDIINEASKTLESTSWASKYVK